MATRDPERYFDRRTIKRHLKRGVVSETDYTRYVDSLPDVSDKIKPRDEGGDDDGYDGRGQPKSQAAASTAPTSLEPHAVMDDDDDDDDDDVDDVDELDTDGDVAPTTAPAPAASAPAAPAPAAEPPVAAPNSFADSSSTPTDDNRGPSDLG